MKNWHICYKFTTLLEVRACVTHQCGHMSKIKNVLSHYCLPRQMLSKMVWHDPVAPMTTEEIDSREKDWMQAKSYPMGTGHWYYPPIVSHNHATKPWKFCLKSVHPFKSYSWISKNMDGRTDRHTKPVCPYFIKILVFLIILNSN